MMGYRCWVGARGSGGVLRRNCCCIFFCHAVGEVGVAWSADPPRPNVGDEGVSLVHHGNVRVVLCTWCTILDEIPLRLLRGGEPADVRKDRDEEVALLAAPSAGCRGLYPSAAETMRLARVWAAMRWTAGPVSQHMSKGHACSNAPLPCMLHMSKGHACSNQLVSRPAAAAAG